MLELHLKQHEFTCHQLYRRKNKKRKWRTSVRADSRIGATLPEAKSALANELVKGGSPLSFVFCHSTHRDLAETSPWTSVVLVRREQQDGGSCGSAGGS